MIFETPPPEPSPRRRAIEGAYREDEEQVVRRLIAEAAVEPEIRTRIAAGARKLVETIRENRQTAGGLDIFLHEYDLSTEEGITLMCLAESLLRVPDADTADKLIRDKIGGADWQRHLGQSDSLFVNASTWALLLTGRIVAPQIEQEDGEPVGLLAQLVAKSGEPVIRQALRHAMHIIGRQFVMGETIEEALKRSSGKDFAAYRFSFDMLGEGARTRTDADRYFANYGAAIAAIGNSGNWPDIRSAPGVSVKLSALHPRYEEAHQAQVLPDLVPKLTALCAAAEKAGIGLTVDAEEADRLELSLDIIEAVGGARELENWPGIGLAVQAYQKRALPVIEWLADLSRHQKRRFMVRLVKGAYWDTEIKRTQEGGFSDFPVFTRKEATDVSYLAAARRLIADPEAFYPMFATHNAHTVVAISEMVRSAGIGAASYEFQRLHGMGGPLYNQLVDENGQFGCRIYAPVGGHVDLLAYLVRRLLENGANSSFVNRLADDQAPIEDIIADPADVLRGKSQVRSPAIALPENLYDAWHNSEGVDLSDRQTLRRLSENLRNTETWSAAPIIGGNEGRGSQARDVAEPANRRKIVGQVRDASDSDIETAVSQAFHASGNWEQLSPHDRAAILEAAADLIEARREAFYALCIREAGKTLVDAVAEVREAADFCRYYAYLARSRFADPTVLPGPTGEENRLYMRGRGVFACISPWNFPLAIFTGQVTAALAAGNAVIAKPAEQTPLIATLAVRCLHEAGVPGEVLNLLPGEGARIGAKLVADARIGGIAFTGSVETGQAINRGLAARTGAIVPLIAETGGMNAMIVDSTALPEQVVDDAVLSAFRSAGQRCSALRVLFVQDDIADGLIKMLVGKAAELVIGDPGRLETDVGPVIDDEALKKLGAHASRMNKEAELLFEAELPTSTSDGCFFAPRIYAIDRLSRLEEEVFGPVLHVIRYRTAEIDEVVEAINDAGYGLTLGIHSRVETTVNDLVSRLEVGNIYVNRNMIGAVVGVQPFGGEGLSGTGPKAGGPHYLDRFAVERTVSVNTAAAGGNAALLSLAASLDEEK